MTTWQSFVAMVFTVGMSFAQYKLSERHPLAPWQAIGSSAYIRVVNLTRDTVPVTVTAPEVDDASRRIGAVAPCDSAVLRLPYSDTRVRVNVAGLVTVVSIDRPDTTRVQPESIPLDACGAAAR